MSSISPQQSQYFKEYITPFQPNGRVFVGADLRGTQCDRQGNGDLRLVGYGDSSGGYAFSPDNQDAAIAPSWGSSNLSNIANGLPRYTEMQDFGGKWIDTITLHALDEFIEQTQPQSFIGNTFRIFAGGQKDYREDGTGKRNRRNEYTLLTELEIPALTRNDIPRSFTVKVGVYIPPAQNIYLGLAIPQPYTCSFQLWDLQANTLVGDGISSASGGSPSVGNGNELSEDLSNTPADTQFVLPIDFASATWVRGASAISGGGTGDNPSPPPLGTSGGGSGGSSQSEDEDNSQPSPDSPSTPSTGDGAKSTPQNPPPSAGCTPIQDCQWQKVNVPTTVGQIQVNTGDYTGLCPKGTVSRGIVEFETSGTFILCCSGATFPPNNLGCSSLMKYSCASGGCIEDAFGTYNSLAECQASLVLPFQKGQCVGVAYKLAFKAIIVAFNNDPGQIGNTTDFLVEGTRTVVGAVSSLVITSNAVQWFFSVNDSLGSTSFPGPATIGNPTNFQRYGTPFDLVLTRSDGLPDTCGNPPLACP